MGTPSVHKNRKIKAIDTSTLMIQFVVRALRLKDNLVSDLQVLTPLSLTLCLTRRFVDVYNLPHTKEEVIVDGKDFVKPHAVTCKEFKLKNIFKCIQLMSYKRNIKT